MKENIIDLHNHTAWSDGINSPEEIIINAINNNVDIIGITDHFQTEKCPSVKLENLSEYTKELKKLKRLYLDKIQVLIGLELPIFPYPDLLDSINYPKLKDLDYILIEYMEFLNPKIPLTSIDYYLNKIPCRKGLAHTDMLRFMNNYGISKVLDFMKRNNIFWEINSNYRYEFFDFITDEKLNKYFNDLFNMFKENNIDISVGSDTHDLEDYSISRLHNANKIANVFNKIYL